MNNNLDLILYNLLHPSFSVRKEGLKEFKIIFQLALENEESGEWKKLREFLWKAIEYEDDENHQAKIVEYSIQALKNKSIKKLIRFCENNKLHNKSVKLFAKQFLNFIDNNNTFYFENEINKSISSSLIREKSHTYLFIYELLKLISLENLKIDNALIKDPLNDLLEIIFSIEIEKSIKTEFTKILLNNKKNLSKIELFIDKFGKNQSIQLGILFSIFTITYEFDTNKRMSKETYKEIQDIKLELNKIICTNYNNIVDIDNIIRKFCENHLFKFGISNLILPEKYSWDNGKSIDLTLLDTYLINSLASRNPEIRKLAIFIMGNFINTKNEKKLNNKYISINEIQIDFWNVLRKLNLELKFIYLTDYSFENINNLLGCDQIEASKNNNYQTGCGILKEMIEFDININDIAYQIKQFLPLKMLVDLSKNDPLPENRSLCYILIGLIPNKIFLNQSVESLVDFTDQIITSLRFEKDNYVILNASYVLTKIMFNFDNLMVSNKKNEYINKLKDKSKLFDNLIELDNKNINPLTIYKLHQLITGTPDINIFIDNLVGLQYRIIINIIDYIMSDLLKYRKLLDEILIANDSRYSKLIAEYIFINIDKIISYDNEEIIIIKSIVETLINHYDVEIRSRSHFILKKINNMPKKRNSIQ